MLLNWKRVLSGAMATALVISSAAVSVSASSYPAIGSTKNQTKYAPINHGIKSVYPLKGKNEVSYWAELNSNVSTYVKSYAETKWGAALMKNTGINVKFVHVAPSANPSAFNLKTATRSMEDIVEYRWNNEYVGGGTAALKDKVVADLAPFLKDGTAPFLSAYLKDNPDVDRQLRTDDGKYYVFPFVRGAESLKTTSGPIVRKDWLDADGLKIPETVADWEVMLTAFKDKNGAKAPLSQYVESSSSITGFIQLFGSAYNVRTSFYVDANGKTVRYAPYAPGYKDLVTLLNKWYKAGLVDKDFATNNTRPLLSAKVTSGQTGAAYGRGGGDLGTDWIPTMQAKDPKADFVGVKFPVLKAGDKIQYSGSDTDYVDVSVGNCAISYTSKKQKLAAQLLDYAYSPEGHILYNFGIEGESYTMKDGKPIMTDKVMKSKKDDVIKGQTLSLTAAWALYARGNGNGPFLQDPGYLEQYYYMPQQANATKQWTTTDNSNKTILPPVTLISSELASEKALLNDIQTYVSEMTTKFVIGTEPIAKFDEFTARLKKMNVEQVIKNKQAAYDRYLKK